METLECTQTLPLPRRGRKVVSKKPQLKYITSKYAVTLTLPSEREKGYFRKTPTRVHQIKVFMRKRNTMEKHVNLMLGFLSILLLVFPVYVT